MTLGVYLDSMFDVILKKENVEDMKSYIFFTWGVRVGSSVMGNAWTK